jgi:hypothetical protein
MVTIFITRLTYKILAFFTLEHICVVPTILPEQQLVVVFSVTCELNFQISLRLTSVLKWLMKDQ